VEKHANTLNDEDTLLLRQNKATGFKGLTTAANRRPALRRMMQKEEALKGKSI
jgi:hypothetical protein